MKNRRVVVTGLGAVTPLGLSVAETWQRVLAGESGVDTIQSFDASDFGVKIAAEVKDFSLEPHLSSKDARKMDIFMQYGIVAAEEAIADAGLQATDETGHRMGVAIGSGIGGLPSIEDTALTIDKRGSRKVSPFFIPGSIINMISGHVSLRHGFRGPNIAIVTACTTGAHNIGYAARTIAYGDADVMVAGGAEKASSPCGIGGFAAMRALSRRNDAPTEASRPWDTDRDGFVLGDGAGVVVLEEYEHARRRGAKIYAELSGVGMSADAYHMTAPDGIGARRSMENAFADAEIPLDQVDYINAHGTSTPTGDEMEARAVEACFGEHARGLAVSSTKSMIGHLLGAAGAVESIFCILALRDQVVPPTINLHNPIEDCVLNLVPNTAQERSLKVVMNNSFGFGGTNGSLLFTAI